MASATACFVIVSRNDIPIYEAELGSSAVRKEDAAHLHQFILHAALDIVQDVAWTTSAMFLKTVDRFNDLAVSVYVTAGHILVNQICYSLNFWGGKVMTKGIYVLIRRECLIRMPPPKNVPVASCNMACSRLRISLQLLLEKRKK